MKKAPCWAGVNGSALAPWDQLPVAANGGSVTCGGSSQDDIGTPATSCNLIARSRSGLRSPERYREIVLRETPPTRRASSSLAERGVTPHFLASFGSLASRSRTPSDEGLPVMRDHLASDRQRCQPETDVAVIVADWQRVSVKTLGARLAWARETLRKMGTNELGKAIGSSGGTISRYESGERTPTTKMARAIASALRIRFDWLTEGTGPLDDKGTPAPSLGDEPTLDEIVSLFPNRWSPNTIDGARAAFLHKRPEQGWEALLDELERLLHKKPTKPAARKATRR